MTPILYSHDQAPIITRAVRLATLADLSFVNAQQKAWSGNVGFLPSQTFERYIERGQIIIAEENGWPAGYISFCGSSKGLVRVLQVAVHHDLLREHVGTDMMRIIQQHAESNGASITRLTCRDGLPANDFWPTIGFVQTAVYARRTTRRRLLREWTKQLPPVIPAPVIERPNLQPTS